MPASPWDFTRIFRKGSRVALEIGSGMGEATMAMATAQPDTALVAIEVHDRGVAALARAVTEAHLDNVRIHVGDAVSALRDCVPSASLDEVRIWFPDPWPKARHHKRRLVNPRFLALVADRLAPGGRVHVATDHAPYAEAIALVLAGGPTLHPELVDGPRPPWRPMTKFEKAGLAAGRRSHDFIYTRAGTSATEPLRR
jgi:tRNA (guanine-N7-)-methyltransferase